MLLTHSQSGPHGWDVADARPELVKAIVAVEPNGPPFYNEANTAIDDPGESPGCRCTSVLRRNAPSH